MKKAMSYPENFFQLNLFLCSITGIWLYKSNGVPKWKKCLQIVWVAIEYTTATIFLTLQILILKETVKDVNRLFSHIGLLMSNALGYFKLGLIILQRNKLERTMDILRDKKYQYESLDQFNPALVLLKAKRISQICTILILCTYTLVGVSAHLSVAKTIHKEVKGSEFEEGHSCQDFIPYDFLIPFEVTTKATCDYILFFMDGSVCVFAWLVGSYDTLFVSILNYLKTHLVILRDAIRLIRNRVLQRLDMDGNLEVFHDEDLPALEEELYNELKHLIQHLTVILSEAEKIENMFNLLILAQTLTSLFNVASCLFNAAKVPVGSSVFFATSTYFVSMLLEFALLCWFGSGITSASEEIMFALYDSDWLSGSRRFKKALLLTMCRVQRPVYLTIGKFFPLTLTTIVSVCKASFSYYTVFRKVEE